MYNMKSELLLSVLIKQHNRLIWRLYHEFILSNYVNTVGQIKCKIAADLYEKENTTKEQRPLIKLYLSESTRLESVFVNSLELYKL